ncbi:MAG: hypothetical protein V4484_06790 [Pseudomonadota bacterium]
MGHFAEVPCQLLPDWRSYHDRLSANIGGGAYPRELAHAAEARLYRVRKLGFDGEFATVSEALAQWSADKQCDGAPRCAIIDILDSATYQEAPQIVLGEGEHLQLRAANLASPVLRMGDDGSGVHEQIRIAGAAGSRLTLDGVQVAGGGIAVDAAGLIVTLRHCTLVPGWEQQGARRAPWRAKPSITLRAAGGSLRVDHCIVGPIRVDAGADLTLEVGDSIIDAGHDMGLAVADAQHGPAQVTATIVRSTVIGLAQVAQLALAENAIFLGPLLVARRAAGSLRFCYLAPGSRTPHWR